MVEACLPHLGTPRGRGRGSNILWQSQHTSRRSSRAADARIGGMRSAARVLVHAAWRMPSACHAQPLAAYSTDRRHRPARTSKIGFGHAPTRSRQRQRKPDDPRCSARAARMEGNRSRLLSRARGDTRSRRMLYSTIDWGGALIADPALIERPRARVLAECPHAPPASAVCLRRYRGCRYGEPRETPMLLPNPVPVLDGASAHRRAAAFQGYVEGVARCGALCVRRATSTGGGGALHSRWRRAPIDVSAGAPALRSARAFR